MTYLIAYRNHVVPPERNELQISPDVFEDGNTLSAIACDGRPMHRNGPRDDDRHLGRPKGYPRAERPLERLSRATRSFTGKFLGRLDSSKDKKLESGRATDSLPRSLVRGPASRPALLVLVDHLGDVYLEARLRQQRGQFEHLVAIA